jgi:phosphoribosylanthranilate isomerase
MVRNLVGSLVYVGQGKHPPAWIAELLAAGDRRLAAPTFAAAGLYLAAVSYPPQWGLPVAKRACCPVGPIVSGVPAMAMIPRIKICGLTRIEDLQCAVQAGADALGLVFYPPSPRYVDLSTAARLARAVPPFVSIVGLFVNADPAWCARRWPLCRSTCCNCTAMKTKPIAGSSIDRTSRRRASGRAWICYNTRLASRRRRRSFSMPSSTVTAAAARFSTGRWCRPFAGQATDSLRWAGCGQRRRSGAPAAPAAVDVSSGVEASKGIKDGEKMRAFVAAVRAAESIGSDGCEAS